MFKNWLKVTNQYKKQNEEDKPSHLLLDGGVLYVKNENLEVFMNKYIQGIINNEKIYLVECKKEIFNLFFDLDFLLDDIKLNEKLFHIIFQIINDTIKDFYNNYYKCIITSADIKVINKIIKNEDEPGKVFDKKFYKKGFHLHFPNIQVNIKTALEIRKKIISDLIYNFKTVYGNNYENIVNNFNDIVDESVFKSSGLRLTGSRKGHYISQTKEWEDEGREYKLEKIIINNKNDNEEFSNYNNNYEKLIKDTSIITLINQITEYNLIVCQECELSPDDEESNNVGTWEKISKNSIIYQEILRFFKLWVKDYTDKDIKRIYVSDNRKTYLLNSKSKYCQNIGTNHNSEHIYFLLTATGIIQKCFCKCNTLERRKYGYCKDYSSNPIPCTPHLLKLLNFKISKSEVVLKVDCSGNKDMIVDNTRDLFYNLFTNKNELKSKKKK